MQLSSLISLLNFEMPSLGRRDSSAWACQHLLLTASANGKPKMLHVAQDATKLPSGVLNPGI